MGPGSDRLPPATVDFVVKVARIVRPRCPYCGSTKLRGYGCTGDIRYYECLECVYPDGSGDLTRFKAIVK